MKKLMHILIVSRIIKLIEIYYIERIEEYPCPEGEWAGELFLHIPNSDIWITNNGYYEEHLENMDWNLRFWEDVEKGDVNLVKVGNL